MTSRGSVTCSCHGGVVVAVCLLARWIDRSAVDHQNAAPLLNVHLELPRMTPRQEPRTPKRFLLNRSGLQNMPARYLAAALSAIGSQCLTWPVARGDGPRLTYTDQPCRNLPPNPLIPRYHSPSPQWVTWGHPLVVVHGYAHLPAKQRSPSHTINRTFWPAHWLLAFGSVP